MERLKQLILDIHRRSLWQVLIVYLGACWAALEAIDYVVQRFLLPQWVTGAVIVVLLIGLPLVLATAFVRETGPAPPPRPTDGLRDPTLLGNVPPVELASEPAPRPRPAIRWLLTWPKAALGLALALLAIGLVSAFIVVRGVPRVAEARGSAGAAFKERAWIVVADFTAPPEERETALAARTALTVDLQQSQFLNVYGRNQIAPVLGRMGLPDTTTVDERIALEIAERQGLAAVLAPSISRLGSDYVFGARVVQPGSRRELIAVRTAAREERLLEGLEALSRELRGRLGEAAAEIRASRPLPEVTTASLEALKRYAEAAAALSGNEQSRALELAKDAIELDSTFAMAYRLASVVYLNRTQLADARRYVAGAYRFRSRLTDRERLHVEAVRQGLDFDFRRAAATYELVLSRYPDDPIALTNLSFISYLWLGDMERAYAAAHRVAEMVPYSALALGNAASGAMTTGRWAVADSLIDAGMSNGIEVQARWLRRDLSFARGEWDRADEQCDVLLGGLAPEEYMGDGYRLCGAIDIARGRLRSGRDRMARAAERHRRAGQYLALLGAVHGQIAADALRGRRSDAGAALERLMADVPPDSIGEPDRFLFRTALAAVAGLHERPDLVDRALARYPGYPDASHWLSLYGEALAAAARALATDRPQEALDRLRAAESLDYEPVPWLPYVDLIAGLAFERTGQPDSAVARLERVIRPERFEGSTIVPHLYLPTLLRRLGELEEARGNRDAAARHYARLLELWSEADPELAAEVAHVRRALARVSSASESS